MTYGPEFHPLSAVAMRKELDELKTSLANIERKLDGLIEHLGLRVETAPYGRDPD